jgi:isoquinoline 1-oxidoreductase alpha subunit
MTAPKVDPIALRVNGAAASVAVDADTPLLWVLRQTLGLPGTKFGCGIAACGACTVHIDGAPVRACVTPVSAALDVPQCGYCQSGQIMSAVALLQGNAAPSDADIDTAMRGNLCRCGTYPRIRAAIHRAAANTTANVPPTRSPGSTR